MLFRKKIPISCEYCAFSTVKDEDHYICSIRGETAHRDKCRKFKYDPCKRTPSKPKAPDFQKYDDYDFSL